ncbi:MAG: hypothetical protein K2F95_05985 [Alistipes sp.]|nr:hypothetical protein [Alistipes sp.]
MKIFSLSAAADRPAHIDPVKALMWGLVWFIFATIFMWYFRLVPNSVLTVGVSGYVPLWGVLLLHASVWVSAGLILSAMCAVTGRPVKTGEVMGRVLYARAPVYLLMLPLAWVRFRVPFSVLMYDPSAAVKEYPSMMVPYLIFAAMIVFWWIFWNYKALTAVWHKRPIAALVLFVAASYLLSAYAAQALMKIW